MTAAFVTVQLEEDRIAGITVNPDMRFGTARSAWPSSSRLDARPFVCRWPRKVHLVGCLAAKVLVRAVFIVPIDDESHFVLEIRLVLGYRDQTQDFLERSMETFNNSNGAVLVDGAESRQDVLRFASDVLEVFTLELGALVDNQVFGLHLFHRHDAIHRRGQFFRRSTALEHGVPNGSS